MYTYEYYFIIKTFVYAFLKTNAFNSIVLLLFV